MKSNSSRFSVFLIAIFLIFPILSSADITEDFDAWAPADSGYAGIAQYDHVGVGIWETNNALVGTTNPRSGSNCIRFQDDQTPPDEYLEFKGLDENGKDGGVGTITFWHRTWDGDGSAIEFKIQKNVNGAGWVDVGSSVVVDPNNTTYVEFTRDINDASDNIRIRVTAVQDLERLLIDDFTITDYSGGSCNPDTTAPDWTVSGVANLVVTDPVTTGDLDLDWDDATDADNPTTIKYAVYRDTSTGFTPAVGNRIVTGLSASVYADSGLVDGTTYFYRIEVYDCAAQTRLNSDEDSGVPTAPASDTIYSVQFNNTIQGAGDDCYSSPRDAEVGVTLTGIVTAYKAGSNYIFADDTGSWDGVYVFDNSNPCTIGDSITITAEVDEYYGLTEMVNVSAFGINSSGNPVPDSTTVTVETIGGSGDWGATCNANTEQYEGVLITLYDVEVSSPSSAFGYWRIKDQGGTLHLGVDDTYYLATVSNGQQIDQISGIL